MVTDTGSTLEQVIPNHHLGVVIIRFWGHDTVEFERLPILAWRVFSNEDDRGDHTSFVMPITVEALGNDPWLFEVPGPLWIEPEARSFTEFEAVKAWARDELAELHRPKAAR